MAAKYCLKVIFAVNTSTYHVSVDDNFGHTSSPSGAYAFYQSVVDPTAFYSGLSTTRLSTVSLTDHAVHSFIGDSRIAGWLMGGEWQLGNPDQYAYFNKYWAYFYGLVHFGGASSSFAGTYVCCGPDNGLSTTLDNIHAFKNFFATSTKPDLYGVEWYGTGSYNLSNISSDIRTFVREMRDYNYSVPTQNIALMEGGTSQTGNPGLSQFYVDAVNRCR